jgi:hypothetical protein
MELRSRAHSLIKDDSGITLNPDSSEYIDHLIYCKLLSIEDTLFCRIRSQDLKLSGRSKVYANSSIVERILSTEGVNPPQLSVIDLRPESVKERAPDVADGTVKTSKGPIFDDIPWNNIPEKKLSLFPEKVWSYPKYKEDDTKGDPVVPLRKSADLPNTFDIGGQKQ